MPMNFPDSPATGAIYSSGGVAWQWNGAAWKAYSTPGAGATVADTPPSSTVNGNLWWNSLGGEGQLYILYNDGTSLQWVVANNLGGGLYLALTGGNLSGPLQINLNATPVPVAAPLHVVAADNSNAQIRLQTFGGTAPNFNSQLANYSARGTAAAPIAIQSGDNIATWEAWPYNGSGYNVGAYIVVSTTETPSASSAGAPGFQFWTATPGSTSNALRAYIGRGLAVGTSDPGVNNIAVAGRYFIGATDILSSRGAAQGSNVANNQGISTTLIMLGLNCLFTPRLTGRVMIWFSGLFNTPTTNQLNSNIRYGTGTPPAQGAAGTGTQVGVTMGHVGTNSWAHYGTQTLMTGLTIGTTYWFDVTISLNAGTGTVYYNSITALEV